jgi:hypothetical protein
MLSKMIPIASLFRRPSLGRQYCVPDLETGGRRVIRLGGVPIPEEKSSFHGGKHMFPNEYDAWLIGNELGETPLPGAHITVGSLRAFNGAAWTTGTTVVVDADGDVTHFNALLANVILLSKNRHELLAYLARVNPGQEEVDRAQCTTTYEEDRDFVYKSLYRRSCERYEFPDEVKAFHAQIAKVKDKDIHQMIGEMLRDGRRWTPTILGSDEVFSRVQSKLREGKIVFINGSLSGSMTMPAVAEALRAAGEEVSVVDLSNLDEYLSEDERQILLDNLKNLPGGEKAHIFRTYRGAYSQCAPDLWVYQGVTLRELPAAIEASVANPVLPSPFDLVPPEKASSPP